MKLAATCLYVDDVPAVLDFYRHAFGFETRFFDEALQFAELDTGGAPGVPPILSFASHGCAEVLMPGGYVRPSGGGPSGVEVAFYTDDVPTAFARAVAAGAVVIAEPKVMPWGQTVAYVRSVEGTLIGLCTPVGEASDTDVSIEAHLRMLEEELLQPDVRKAATRLDVLLAEGFIEFGSSGRVFDKQAIIDTLRSESPVRLSLSDFKALHLGPGVVLTTYRAVRYGALGEQPIHSLRSSVWRLLDGRWQMMFHQGTRSEGSGEPHAF